MPTCSKRSTRLADDLPDGARALAVARHVGLDEDRARAAPVGLGGAHRRADAEPAGLVAGRGDDAAAARIAADDERLAAQLGPVELLDGGEERVEVEVRDHARRVRTGEVPAATASLPVKTARTDGAPRQLDLEHDARALDLEPRRRRRAARRARRCSSVTRTPASAREPVTTTPIGRPAGRSGSGGTKRRDAQRGRALHRADVGELQTGRVVARDRERDAAAAQRGDGHAHGAPALARDRRAERPPARAQRDAAGCSPAMPRIQTLDGGRVERDAEESRAQLERAGCRPSAGRRPGRPTARRAAPRTRRMPAATCSLSPTRARSTASCRPITGSSTGGRCAR